MKKKSLYIKNLFFVILLTFFTANVTKAQSVSWTDNFTSGVTPTGAQCTNWNNFRALLTPRCYTQIKISGTFDVTGITVVNQADINIIAANLLAGIDFNLFTNGHQWTYCASRNELWLDPPSLCSGANCPVGYILRPCQGNYNYGGVNTATCNPPTQTMNLDFNYGAAPAAAGIITGTASVCLGQTGVVYTVPPIANATGYNWSFPAGATIVGGANTNSVTVNFALNAVSGVVTVIGTSTCGAGQVSPNFILTVLPLPAAAGIITGPISVCKGSTGIVFSVAAIVNAVGYNWIVPVGATITAGANTVSITVNFSIGALSGNVIVTGTNTCGNGTLSSHNIVLNPLPTVALANLNAVCVNAAAFALSGGTPIGGTYSGVGVAGGSFNPALAGVGTHTITYSYTNGNGCQNFATKTIVVNPLPTVTLSNINPICVDAQVFPLNGGAPVGGTYSGVGVAGGNFDPAVAGAGTHTVTYTFTNGNSCQNSATNTIVVNPLPVVGLTNQNTVCVDAASFTLTGGTPIGGGYSGNGVVFGNFDAATAGVGTHTITYTYFDGNGCSNSASNTIVVNPLPTVTLSFTLAPVCVDVLPYALAGGIPAGGTYSGVGVAAGNFSPVVAGVGTHVISYTYADANGCQDIATNNIIVDACTGISENTDITQLSVFPNPTNGMFTVDLTINSEQQIELELLNTLGDVVKVENYNLQKGNSKISVSIKNLSKGMYYVKTQTEKGIFINSIIVNQ